MVESVGRLVDTEAETEESMSTGTTDSETAVEVLVDDGEVRAVDVPLNVDDNVDDILDVGLVEVLLFVVSSETELLGFVEVAEVDFLVVFSMITFEVFRGDVVAVVVLDGFSVF